MKRRDLLKICCLSPITPLLNKFPSARPKFEWHHIDISNKKLPFVYNTQYGEFKIEKRLLHCNRYFYYLRWKNIPDQMWNANEYGVRFNNKKIFEKYIEKHIDPTKFIFFEIIDDNSKILLALDKKIEMET